jgi:hypothetical protein
MATTQDRSTGLMLVLTEAERVQLLSWLEQIQREKLVEEHRTKTLEYRELVLQERGILEGLINKLSRG